MLALKILVIVLFAFIAFQDFKERAVYWVLFPMMGLVLAALYLQEIPFAVYVMIVSINILMISIILILLYMYTTHIAQKKFLNVSFGLGDFLFFYAFALGYPTYTFLVLFVGSILFALIVFLFVKFKNNAETVPLAGLMGIFLIAVTAVSTLPNVPSLYTL